MCYRISRHSIEAVDTRENVYTLKVTKYSIATCDNCILTDSLVSSTYTAADY